MSDPYYRTAAWRMLRAAVLARDPVCATPGCGRASTDADHIRERRDGGLDVMSNLRGLCHACHGQRSRGLVTPRAKGCAMDGTPHDPGHWWRQ